MEPVDETEIWGPILADPLYWPPSSDTIPLPSQVEEYFSYVYNYGMGIDHFVEDPQDKTWRDQYLGELIPKKNWKCGPRASRKRRIFPLNPPYLGDVPSGSQDRKCQCRKNNKHWTHEEVINLVEGVERYGIGKWRKVKSRYFSKPSIRDPTHLKDKWRNLRRACGVPCNSKRKKKTQKKLFFPIDATIIKRIQRSAMSLRSRKP